MALLLNWRVWVAIAIAAALAFSHLTAYRSGKQNVRNEWKASVAQANIDARETERLRQRSVDKAVDAAASREIGLRADAARAAGLARGLRDDLAALKSRSQSCPAEADRTAAIGALLAESIDVYRELATACDRHVNDIRMLQEAWPR